MGKGGGGGTQTVVNTQDIPPFLRDQLIQTFGEVENFRPRSDTVCLLYTSPSPRDRG